MELGYNKRPPPNSPLAGDGDDDHKKMKAGNQSSHDDLAAITADLGTETENGKDKNTAVKQSTSDTEAPPPLSLDDKVDIAYPQRSTKWAFSLLMRVILRPKTKPMT